MSGFITMDNTDFNSSSINAMRIIDASLNRVGEGLRVLEDIARLGLSNPRLTRQLKNMRHRLEEVPWADKKNLLASRDATGDVGAFLETDTGSSGPDLGNFIVANARRAEQGLRVIEELAKMETVSIDSEIYKQARFNLYTLESEMVSMLTRKGKQNRIKGLCVVLDAKFLGNYSYVDMARAVIKAGTRVVIIGKVKGTDREVFKITSDLRELCSQTDSLLIINGRLDLALACNADGLHLHQHDLPAGIARKYLPVDTLVGVCASSASQATQAESEGADFITSGQIFASEIKFCDKIIGIEALKQIRKASSLPVVAIGGINHANIGLVVSAGADAVAVNAPAAFDTSFTGAFRRLSDTVDQ